MQYNFYGLAFGKSEKYILAIEFIIPFMNISCSKWSDFGWPGCICQYCACLAIMSNRVCKRRFVVQFPHRTGGTSENLGERATSKTRSFDGTVCASDLAKIWRGFGGKLPPSPFLPWFRRSYLIYRSIQQPQLSYWGRLLHCLP